MLVKCLQSFCYIPHGLMQRESVVDLPDDVAAGWIKSQIAEPLSPEQAFIYALGTTEAVEHALDWMESIPYEKAIRKKKITPST